MKVCTDACILGALAAHPNPRRILDIGAGTGLLSLMLAQRYPCPVDGVEIHPAAFQEAQENIATSPWPDRVSVFLTRIQDFASSSPYDLIVSNPPFFHRHRTPADDGRRLALHDGALPYSDLVKAALKHLSPGGLFFVLLHPGGSAAFTEMMSRAGFHLRRVYRIRNTAAKPVFRTITAYSHTGGERVETDFVISTEAGEYAEAFKEALRPYYLNI